MSGMPRSAADRGSGPDLIDVVPLGSAGVLRVRRTRASDATALEQFYEQLDEADRYRRFFSSCTPSRRFIEHWAAIAAVGGAGLVVEIQPPAGDVEPTIIAEAGFVPIGPKVGELAICVASRWRGWLGPYLLDLLLDEARALGIEALEADVLCTNGPMLALARFRSAEFRPHDDPAHLRIRMSTEPR